MIIPIYRKIKNVPNHQPALTMVGLEFLFQASARQHCMSAGQGRGGGNLPSESVETNSFGGLNHTWSSVSTLDDINQGMQGNYKYPTWMETMQLIIYSYLTSTNLLKAPPAPDTQRVTGIVFQSILVYFNTGFSDCCLSRFFWLYNNYMTLYE